MATTVNRRQAPPLVMPSYIRLPEPQHLPLLNGIPVFSFSKGQQEIVMIKWLFPAGAWQEPAPQRAYLTSRMLKEGTQKHTAQALADAFEQTGATLQISSKNNHAEIVVHTLNKHLPTVLPLVKEMLTESVFPEPELARIVANTKQHLLVNAEKVETVADDRFKELLWGEKHPYGYRNKPENFDNVTSQELEQFYKTHYTAENCHIYMAGKINDTHTQLIEHYFGGKDWLGNGRIADQDRPFAPFEPNKKEYVQKKDSLQAAIRIGRPLFNKTHPDYQGLFVLNTLLGGFFGSRLMSNIREDKGYTYGIYSDLASYIKAGSFHIATEVNADVREDAVREIFFEIERLCNDLVDEDELDLVRRYLLGTMLMQHNTVFGTAAAVQGLLVYGLGIDFYAQFSETVRSITPQQLRNLAQQYLRPEQMLEVVAGN